MQTSPIPQLSPNPLKILVLSWEFPPRIVGGICRHVAELYPVVVALGHEVHLLTVEFGNAPSQEGVEGIQVHRVPVASGNDFFHWIANMNQSMREDGSRLLEEGDFDLIHAHDWLVGDAAIALKNKFHLPLVATIHATEYGRHNGIHTEEQRHIHQQEYDLTHSAERIIVCSKYMRREIRDTLAIPEQKVDVVYNGIRWTKKQLNPRFNYADFRRRFAADDEKIVYYLGRMTYEKGIFVLLNAAPQVLAQMGNKVKIVIIGGGKTEDLKAQAWNLGIWHKCYFTGFMPESDLNHFQVIADCAVFPSLYEPFGIVALESFAARVPVVVSDTCGLPEVVQHSKTGVVTRTNDPDSLAWGILDVLKHPDYGEQLVENAYADLSERFDWLGLAQKTQHTYQVVMHERSRIL